MYKGQAFKIFGITTIYSTLLTHTLYIQTHFKDYQSYGFERIVRSYGKHLQINTVLTLILSSLPLNCLQSCTQDMVHYCIIIGIVILYTCVIVTRYCTNQVLSCLQLLVKKLVSKRGKSRFQTLKIKNFPGGTLIYSKFSKFLQPGV